MGSFSQYSAKRGSQDLFQISSSYCRGKWSFLFVLIFIEFQQNSIEYFRNDASIRLFSRSVVGQGFKEMETKLLGWIINVKGYGLKQWHTLNPGNKSYFILKNTIADTLE